MLYLYTESFEFGRLDSSSFAGLGRTLTLSLVPAGVSLSSLGGTASLSVMYRFLGSFAGVLVKVGASISVFNESDVGTWIPSGLSTSRRADVLDLTSVAAAFFDMNDSTRRGP